MNEITRTAINDRSPYTAIDGRSLHTAIETIRASLEQAQDRARFRLEARGDDAVCRLYETLESKGHLAPVAMRSAVLAYSFSSASPATTHGHGLSAHVSLRDFSLRSKLLLLTLCDGAPETLLDMPQERLDYIATFRRVVAQSEQDAVTAERELAEDVAYTIAFGLVRYAECALLQEEGFTDKAHLKDVLHRVTQADAFLGKCLSLREPYPHDEEGQAVNWIMRAVKALCSSLACILRIRDIA